MKICLIGPIHPLRGGIAHYNAQLGLELANRHEIVMISFSRQYPTLLFPGRTQLDPNSKPPGLTAEALLDSLNPLSWVKAARRIAELSPDLIVVHWWNPFFAPCIGTTLRLVKRRSRAVVVFVCHNILPHESRRPRAMPSSCTPRQTNASSLQSGLACEPSSSHRPQGGVLEAS